MKSSLKISLGLVLGSLMALPAVMTAQDMGSSQPATSAPASSDSATTTTSSTAPSTETSDSSAPKHSHKGGHDQSKRMVNMLKEKLNLTDDEVTKVQAIVDDQGKQMATINGDTSLSDDDKKSKIDALRKSTHDQIRALLTPDQQTTFDSMKMGGHQKKADNN